MIWTARYGEAYRIWTCDPEIKSHFTFSQFTNYISWPAYELWRNTLRLRKIKIFFGWRTHLIWECFITTNWKDTEGQKE